MRIGIISHYLRIKQNFWLRNPKSSEDIRAWHLSHGLELGQERVCFRAMKTAGFNIEDTHLRDIDRIARLTAMVCLALVWACLVGEHKDANVKAVKRLKYGRRAKSLVKNGLEEISNVPMHPLYKPKFDVFKFLSRT